MDKEGEGKRERGTERDRDEMRKMGRKREDEKGE